MSQGSNTTQMSYECSRQNASINYGTDFSEWENEFKEGIELKKGDTVRLLGSFVHQGSTSEEIEVEQDMELNIAYSPFIVADTIDTLDTTAEGTLQDLSDLGDIAYSTDSFGIEPPLRVTTQNGTTDDTTKKLDEFHQADFTVAAKKSFPSEDSIIQASAAVGDATTAEYNESAYSDPAITAERGGDFYGNPVNLWSINSTEVPGATTPRTTMVGDNAEVFGMNLRTNELFNDKNKIRHDYQNFTTSKANCEMYIGNMVKKLILPVFNRFTNFNTTANPKGTVGGGDKFRRLDALVDNPDVGNFNMLNGMPKVGMCIATVNIAQTSGWNDANGNAYWENTWDADGNLGANFDGTVTGGGPYRYAGTSGYTGIPNLAGGVESVIGTIIATRPVKHNIMGKSTDCWELMVSEFVNPATLSDKPIIKNFPINKLTKADTFVTGTGADVNCFKKIHGSGTTDTNANFNPSINNINGAFNQITQGITYPVNGVGDGYKTGIMTSTPTRNNYLKNAPENGPNFRTEFEKGGPGFNAGFTDMGLGQNQGLSFLWNGSHTGYLRYNSTVSNVDRYRANHKLEWGRDTDDNLVTRSTIHDVRLIDAPHPGLPPVQDTTFFRNAELMEMGSVPVCFGAYIITQKKDMLDIAKGQYTNISQYHDTTQDVFQPRIWFDYAFQQTESSYTTRHYKGNSYDCSEIVESAPTGTDKVFPRGLFESKFEQSKTPPFTPDNRFGYAMCGRPLNLNYRSSSGETGLKGQAGVIHDTTFVLSGNSGQNQNLKLSTTDFMPRYYNTVDGNTVFPPEVLPDPLAPTPRVAFRGLPAVWGGYNTCLNSIYFQQKETGDTKLGSTSFRAKGFCHFDTDILANSSIISISKATLLRTDTGAVYVPEVGNFIRIVGLNDCQYNNVNKINLVDLTQPDYVTLTIGKSNTTGNGNWLKDIPAGQPIIISKGPSYMPNAVGVNGNAWAGDHIMVKESFVKIKVKSGFYTEEQLAERINDQLHYNTQEFKKRFGTKNADGTYSIPTTTGNKETALTSQPSILNGNFVNTYIPDINYAFAPITTTNADELGLTASTKDITNELLSYEPLNVNAITYYWSEELPLTSTPDTNVRKLSDHSEQYPTILGKHFKMYTIPSLDKETATLFKEISLMRLRGGSLNTQLDFIADDTGPTYWHNKQTRFAGSYEMLRDFTFHGTVIPGGADFSMTNSTTSTYSYRTRFTRNVFPAGGSARVFCGANNFTFSWEEGANRYSFNNLYTPVRPHKPETNGTDAKEDFGIGDAIPSAIINSRPNGTIISQLSGIYINNLNGDLFTQQNWGTPSIGNDYQYDLITTQERIFKNTTFLNILGYTLDQAQEFNNSFNDVVDIFLFRDFLTQSGSAIRVGAKINTSINASNPIASKCLTIAPVTQFMVQVSTDDFFAKNSPLKGNDPYFFIGSTFPFKQFYGNDNGGKLPIMGICARNFQAFGFSFDLGGSAVQYLIEEDTTITSIRTKIYTSQLQTPTNLSPYSSIIYLITRYNYLKNLTPQQGEMQLQQTIANMNRPMMPWVSPPLALARTAPPVDPNKYYYTGYPATIQEEEEEEED